MIRNSLAVIVGLISTILLSGVTTALINNISGSSGPPYPVSEMLISVIYNTIFSVVGGYITAWIAGQKEIALAGTVGVIMLILSFGGEFIAVSPLPLWYKVITFLITVPAFVVGAKFHQQQRPALV